MVVLKASRVPPPKKKNWVPIEPISSFRRDLGVTCPKTYCYETLMGWEDRKLELAFKTVNGWWDLFGPTNEMYTENEHQELVKYHARIVDEMRRRGIVK